jgi:hypothetical protein
MGWMQVPGIGSYSELSNHLSCLPGYASDHPDILPTLQGIRGFRGNWPGDLHLYAAMTG